MINSPTLFQYFFTFKIKYFAHFLLKNIILHQKLHINHQKNVLFFDFPDTLRLSLYDFYFSIFVCVSNQNCFVQL